jgi:hypothetical protein
MPPRVRYGRQVFPPAVLLRSVDVVAGHVALACGAPLDDARRHRPTVLTLPVTSRNLHTGERVYWLETNFGDESERDTRHIIGTGSADVSEAEFAQVFFASNGATFNVDGCCGSPPMEISTSLPRGEFLIDLFVAAFTAANSFGRIDVAVGRALDLEDAEDRRELVEHYLDTVVN